MKIQTALLFLAAGLPLHAADACDTVLPATETIWQVPVHVYTTTETTASGKKQLGNTESIYTGGLNGAVYQMADGKWSRSPGATGELKASRDALRADDKDAAKPTCRYLRDEAVNGEAAAVYSIGQPPPQGPYGHDLDLQKPQTSPAHGLWFQLRRGERRKSCERPLRLHEREAAGRRETVGRPPGFLQFSVGFST